MNHPNHRDPQTAFESAIVNGLLSDDESAANFAGSYMYMGDIDGSAQFKNINTRSYISHDLEA